MFKLYMFGFGIVLENINEVKKRLAQIPISRAVEGLEQCYLINLKTAQKYAIIIKNNSWEIQNLT